mmetsp:Transcript_48748/g.155855  ORF Transcript_48748/g.155855 Transcript_48748/m.155855 type:complete len:310 (+) Transcript_48748:68-997(+)
MASQRPPKPYYATKNAHPDLSVLSGGVAVVTGSANGIGYSLAEAALAHGLHVALADVDSVGLTLAEEQLRAKATGSVEVFSHVTDVSSEASVRSLAAAVAEHFNGIRVSLLCCNAGIGGGGIIASPDAEWQRTFGVNVFGVAHCLRAFVPAMLAHKAPGAVVTTSSQDGICASQGIYGASKHACVALSEGLYQELGGRLSVHVLCPHVTATKLFAGAALRDGTASPGTKYVTDKFAEFGSPPSLMADMVFDAIRTGKFYVFGENDREPGFVRLQAEVRMKAMLDGGLPFRPPSEIFRKVFSPPPKASRL